MQTLANVLNMPIKIVASDQTPALVRLFMRLFAAGVYPMVIMAAEKMGSDLKAEICSYTRTGEQLLPEIEAYNSLCFFYWAQF